jgi:hypothetical protein
MFTILDSGSVRGLMTDEELSRRVRRAVGAEVRLPATLVFAVSISATSALGVLCVWFSLRPNPRMPADSVRSALL